MKVKMIRRARDGQVGAIASKPKRTVRSNPTRRVEAEPPARVYSLLLGRGYLSGRR